MASTGAQQTIRPFTAGRHNQASVRPRSAQRRLRLDPRSRSERRQALVWQAVLSLLAGAILMLAAATALFYRSDRIAPGVEVAGVAVGGRSTAEAALLRAGWQQRVVTLEANGATWTVPIETLGILLDAEATVERAYGKGRSLTSLREFILSGGGRQVDPIWRFDPAVAEAALAELQPRVEVAPVDAGLRVVEGRAEVVPAVSGQTLDMTATVAW
ncbi:MAG TPA: peptidoglycan binding domain-containing protein, partial [Ardenticatenaceae bacterium]|nr:peptidoglycan binding domain-containing protein [Ardenticatenaceae bacterium]